MTAAGVFGATRAWSQAGPLGPGGTTLSAVPLGPGAASVPLGPGAAGGNTFPANLPQGNLIGVWDASQYQATPRRAIPNLISSDPVSTNLLTAPRRQFSNIVYATITSATVTDNSAAGPDGAMFAANINGTGNWAVIRAIASLPAGTYTFAIDVKSNTGSAQTIRYGLSSALQSGSVTTSWSTLLQTFTTTSGAKTIYVALSSDGTTAGNILVDNVRLYAGVSDLGAQSLIGAHMYLGTDSTASDPVVSAGAMSTSVAQGSIIQLPSLLTISAFTVLAVASKVSEHNTYEPVIGVASATAATQLTTLTEYINADTPNSFLGGSPLITPASPQFSPSMNNPVNSNFQMFGATYDGMTSSQWVNATKLVSTPVSARTGSNIGDFWVGLFAGSSFPAHSNFAIIAFWTRALSNAEMVSAYTTLLARCSANGVPTTPPSKFVLVEGDSITAGGSGPTITGPYPQIAFPSFSPLCTAFKAAVGGSTLQISESSAALSLYGRQAFDNAMIPANKGGVKYVYTVLIGHNDQASVLYGSNPTQFAADVGTFCLSQKAAGWDKIVLGTLLPSSAGGFNAWRNTVNTIWTGAGWIAANGVDVIFDIASDLTIGTDVAGFNVIYYPDGTHPSNACIAIIAPYYVNAINGLG